MELLEKRRPIDSVISDPSVDERVRQNLEMIQEARAFAVRELLLPDNDSYSEYADLGRPYALWNVFATPAYSLEPKQWCYPFVGCISYRNYFSQLPAQAYADSLQEQGYDVYVAGVPAYSTLGWFDDPVMNTMMHWQDYDLVGTLFHELTHQKFYIPGDTVFNESLARAVEQEGLRRWMAQHKDSRSYRQYLQESAREREFIQLVLGAREKLSALYASGLSEQAMFPAKLDIFRQLRRDYLELRTQWDGYDAYDRWMLSGVNNAKVQSVATYHDYLPAFNKILQQQQGDLADFYRQIESLMEMDTPERRAYLRAVMAD
jgi:predicted aminopeptidase